jgi:membrane protein required for colicin V production
MNYFDYILLLPVLYGLYRGFSKGFILELASLLALVLGIYGAMHFSSFTFTYLSEFIELESSYLQLASYGVTFLAIVIVVTLSAKVLTLLIKMVALGFINRMMGAIFGGFKALLILAVLLLFFDGINHQFRLVNQSVLDASLLYHPIRKNAETIYPNVLEEYEKQKQNIEDLEQVL